MNDRLLELLIDDSGSVESLRDAIGDDARAQSLAEAWIQLEATVQNELLEALPESDLFVIGALESAGRGDLLDESDRSRLIESGFDFDTAASSFAGLQDVSKDLSQQAADFDNEWLAEFRSEHKGRTDRPAKARQPRSTLTRRSPWSMRAIVGLVVTGFLITTWILGQGPAFDVSLTAVADGVELVELPDGSSVRLLDGATLEYASDFDRRVQLTGRALFDVLHADTPFVVYTESALTTVLGTRFGVTTGPEETRVALIDGRVSVASSSYPEAYVILEPGQKTRVPLGGRPEPAAQADLHEELFWSRLLILRDTPMREAAERFEKTYGLPLAVHESLLQERVTGTFDESHSARMVVEALSVTLDALFEELPDGGFRIAPR